MKTYNNSY